MLQWTAVHIGKQEWTLLSIYGKKHGLSIIDLNIIEQRLAWLNHLRMINPKSSDYEQLISFLNIYRSNFTHVCQLVPSLPGLQSTWMIDFPHDEYVLPMNTLDLMTLLQTLLLLLSAFPIRSRHSWFSMSSCSYILYSGVLRHFNLSHVLFHHIHKPPVWPSPFPLSWHPFSQYTHHLYTTLVYRLPTWMHITNKHTVHQSVKWILSIITNVDLPYYTSAHCTFPHPNGFLFTISTAAPKYYKVVLPRSSTTEACIHTYGRVCKCLPSSLIKPIRQPTRYRPTDCCLQPW